MPRDVRRSTFSGVAGGGAPSLFGRGITFHPGSSDNFRNYSAQAAMNIGTTTDFWVHFIIKITNNVGNHYIFAGQNNSSPSAPGFQFKLAGGSLDYIVYANDSSFDNASIAAPGIFDGQPHLIEYFFDRDVGYSVSLDSVLLDSFPLATISGKAISPSGASISIYPWNADSFFDGTIYEVAMGTGTPPTRTAPYAWLPVGTSGLKAHWKMNELSGNITDEKSSIVLTAFGSPTYNGA